MGHLDRPHRGPRPLVQGLSKQAHLSGASIWGSTFPQSSLAPPLWVFRCPKQAAVCYQDGCFWVGALWGRHLYLDHSSSLYRQSVPVVAGWLPQLYDKIFFVQHLNLLSINSNSYHPPKAIRVVATHEQLCTPSRCSTTEPKSLPKEDNCKTLYQVRDNWFWRI